MISLPQGGGALQGLGEKFSPDLYTGTGNFTVPIALPPGRGDIQPELQLVYSTGTGNTAFGLGWGLSIPGVRRKTSRGVPRYNGDDVFVLSGFEDLVPVPSGTVGAVLYRPRTEAAFTRIIRHQDAANDYWEVTSKDGVRSVYGTPGARRADPAVVASPTDRDKVFAWQLSQTRDPFGNLITYDYVRDAGAEGAHHWDQLYLKRFRYANYTDNGSTRYLVSVTFLYEDRPDSFSEYRPGFEIRTRKRCHAIEIHTHADQPRLNRLYRLTYLDEHPEGPELLPHNGFSLLSRIQAFGRDGASTEALPPLEFGYTPFTPGHRDFFPLQGETLPVSALSDPNLEMADLFGNGLPDLLETNGTVQYWRNRGNGTFDTPREMPRAPSGIQLADSGVQMIDADGNGLVDLLVSTNNLSGYYPMRAGGLWDERAFRRYETAPSFYLDDPDVALMDLDGDGVTDAVRWGSRIECFFNDPQKGWHETRWIERQALEGFPNVTFDDPHVKLADMTGDGLQDVIVVHDGTVEYWPSLGRGDWAKRVTMQNNPRFPYGYDPGRILLGDVDGDGLTDLVYVDDTRVTLWINQSGNRWSDPIEIQGTPPVSNTAAIRLADVLGTGIRGVLWSSEQSSRSRDNLYFLDFTGGTKPGLLHEIDNHMGSLTRIEYASSTRFYLDDEKRSETQWRTSLPFPVQVVSRVESIDEISGGKLTTEYTYRHGHWDGVEREFRGFGRVDQRDTEEFGRFHEGALHADRPFDAVPSERFSPATEKRSWFHQGPIGDAFGDWEESDYEQEYWAGDPQVFERPAAMKALLAGLSRSDRRDALRTLRGSLLRTELYALDGSDVEDRPFTVTEHLYGVREEAPPATGETRQRIFFSHQLGQRTTQWERGDDPMTRFDLTDAYDAYGQPRSQMTIGVPRGRDYRLAGPSGEPYLVKHVTTTYAEHPPEIAPTEHVGQPNTVNGVYFAEILGLEAEGETLRKVAPTGWTNAGAVSVNKLEAGEYGWVEASTSTLGLRAFFGLSEQSADHHYNTIEYAAYFSNSNALMIYESGNHVQSVPGLNAHDVVRIERHGSTVYYKLNGEVIHVSSAPSVGELRVDLAFYDEGAELRGLTFSKAADSVFIVDRIARTTSYDIVNDGAPDVFSLQASILDGSATRRVVAQELRYYDGDAHQGLPFGQIGAYGALTRSESLVLTEDVLQEAYKSSASVTLPPELPPYLESSALPNWTAEYPQAFRDQMPALAGYTFYDGSGHQVRGYFATTKSLRYDIHNSALPGRGLHLAQRDPLGHETTYTYDVYDLLPTQVTDPYGLTTHADHDYRLLRPALATDVNGNRTRYAYTPLGFLSSEAHLGKVSQSEGDTEQEPSTRYEYGFSAFADSPPEARQPTYTRTIRRLYHVQDATAPLSEQHHTVIKVEYGDGYGRLIQVRTQAEDVLYGDSGFGGDVISADLAVTPGLSAGRARAGDDPENVAVSGWQIYDNKGRVVQRFEPFFSQGFDYGRPQESDLGNKVETFYDALGRVVRIVNPDDSTRRTVFGVPTTFDAPDDFEPTPWETYTYDENDTANAFPGAHQVDAAHFHTPASTEVDALGRTVKSVTRSGPDAADEHVMRSTYDIRDNLLTLTDALGRQALSHTYDLAPTPRIYRIESIDGGLERLVYDARGLEVESRDGKGALQLQSYDLASRPNRLWARDYESLTVTLRQHLIYGEDAGLTQPEDANLLSALYEHYDEAGRLRIPGYDFKGNALAQVRQVLANQEFLTVMGVPNMTHYQVDWDITDRDSLLDAKLFRIDRTFDALNRAQSILYPEDADGERKEALPIYNRAGALEQVKLVSPTVGTEEIYVRHIAYDARGQRSLVAFGNGLMSRQAYDPKTSRLLRKRVEGYTIVNGMDFAPQGSLLQDLGYEHDLMGNVTKIRERSPGCGIPNSVLGQDALDRDFEYDPLYRLTLATGREHLSHSQTDMPWERGMSPTNQDTTQCRAYIRHYTYDKVGSLLSQQHVTADSASNFTRIFNIAAGNNVLDNMVQGTVTYICQQDAVNNLTREGISRHYYWNHRNQLHAFRIENGAVSLDARYLYDASGQRVKKIVRTQGGAVRTTTYVGGISSTTQMVARKTTPCTSWTSASGSRRSGLASRLPVILLRRCNTR